MTHCWMRAEVATHSPRTARTQRIRQAFVKSFASSARSGHPAHVRDAIAGGARVIDAGTRDVRRKRRIRARRGAVARRRLAGPPWRARRIDRRACAMPSSVALIAKGTEIEVIADRTGRLVGI